jgi:DNA polymerase-3 subunit delta'
LVKQTLGLGGDDWREIYAETLASLVDREYLEAPLPDVERDPAVDGFNIATDHLFGKGSVPSRECYTPGRIAETIRKAHDQGKLPETEYRLLRLLYEYPLSVMPCRGAIPIAYITARQGWQFTRPVQSFLARRSLMGGKKVVIIDDAHKMTPQAQNCLLKTLEEPPEDSVIILITSEPESLFATILSRCQVVRFKRLTADEMADAVESLVGDTGERAGVITALAGNCPGRALELSLSRVEEQLDAIRDLLDHLVEGRPECVFAFSRSVLGEGSAHRRKLRVAVRSTLELLVFWLMETVRVGSGIDGGPLPEKYTSAMRKHAAAFDEAALLAMSKEIENTFDIISYNIDLSLLLDTTLLKIGTGA